MLRPIGGWILGVDGSTAEQHRQLLLRWGQLSRWLLHPCVSLRSSNAFSSSPPLLSLFTLRVFEASCGSPLSRLTSTHGSHPGPAVTSCYCNIKEQRVECVCSSMYVELCICVKVWVCEDLRLLEPAALSLTSTIKAACEYRSVFIPVKCQSRFFLPYTVSY